jgi:hypothetical protein
LSFSSYNFHLLRSWIQLVQFFIFSLYDSSPAIIYSEFSFGTAEISLAIYGNVTLRRLSSVQHARNFTELWTCSLIYGTV